jgi:gluconate:H+ symporter, GntP family
VIAFLLPTLLANLHTGPFVALGLSVAWVVVAVVVFRLPAFFSLIVAGALVGVISVPKLDLLGAMTAVTTEFGATAGRLGLTIALAAVIGASLMESGAADRIVRTLIAKCGMKHAPLALLLGAFLLSGPVFVDTVLLLLLPIAQLLSVRTGGNVVLYLLAVGVGALLANGTIPPAPGPLIMAETLHLNLGIVLLGGLVFDIVPAISSLWASRWLSARITPSGETAPKEAMAPDESALPGTFAAFLPVTLPFGLLALASLVTLPALKAGLSPSLFQFLKVAGDKNIALAIGAIVAVVVYARQKHISWRRVGSVLGKPVEVAGGIILIVSAGSAYGKMIERTGLGVAVHDLAGGGSVNFVLLGWGLAAAMRVAQGSATVAVVTAIGIVAPIAASAGSSVHPLYLFLAIGYGSKFMPWMNDVGFWLFARWGGMTPGETIRSWTFMSSFAATVGLAEVLLVSWQWPHLPF